MTCDSHVHLGMNGTINKCFLNFEQLADFREKNRIDNMLVFPFERDHHIVSEKLAEYAKHYDWLKPLRWMSKSLPFKKLDGFVGCKFHGMYEEMPISSPVYQEMLEVLEDNAGILLVHCGRYLEASLQSNTSYLHVIKIASAYPNITFILGHMGGSDTGVIKRAVVDAAPYRNILFETSGITTPYAVEFATEHLNYKRILFGSDAPWCSFRAMVANVEDANISEKAKEMILHDNFLRLELQVIKA